MDTVWERMANKNPSALKDIKLQQTHWTLRPRSLGKTADWGTAVNYMALSNSQKHSHPIPY
jgi:hypothetical protein